MGTKTVQRIVCQTKYKVLQKLKEEGLKFLTFKLNMLIASSELLLMNFHNINNKLGDLSDQQILIYLCELPPKQALYVIISNEYSNKG